MVYIFTETHNNIKGYIYNQHVSRAVTACLLVCLFIYLVYWTGTMNSSMNHRGKYASINQSITQSLNQSINLKTLLWFCELWTNLYLQSQRHTDILPLPNGSACMQNLLRNSFSLSRQNCVLLSSSPSWEEPQSPSPSHVHLLQKRHREHPDQLHRCVVRLLQRVLLQDPPVHCESCWEDHRCLSLPSL